MSSSIRTINARAIAASPGLVYELAADVEAWPQILGHYRYVRVLGGTPSARLVAMGATRSGIPVSWTAEQEQCPDRLEIAYRHVRGVTRGMEVLWRIEPLGAGSRAVITHALDLGRWWLRNGVSQHIVGELFVAAIAERTLAGIGARAEALEVVT